VTIAVLAFSDAALVYGVSIGLCVGGALLPPGEGIITVRSESGNANGSS
jgi:hypothetical protein